MISLFPTQCNLNIFNFQNSDCKQQHTVHVDEFLYDNETVDALCDEGKLVRNYCLQCGSFNTRPLSKYPYFLIQLTMLIAS
jgi:hypothetical protein